MTLVRKFAFALSSLGVAALGVLAAGALNTAEALTLPTGTTLTVTVPTVLPPTVTVPPVTTALPPPPPVVTTVLPPVTTRPATTALPPVPRPPTATIVVPPPPAPVATVTTRVPTTPSAPAVTAVGARRPDAPPAPVATATVPARASGNSAAPGGAATPQSASSAETAPNDAGASFVVGSSGASGVHATTDGLSAGTAQAEAARRSSVVRVRAEQPGLVRGKKGAQGVITFTFRLPRRGTVVVTVTRVAPSCRVVGSFEVRGRPGVNRVRWSGRVDGRLLPPGTYRLAPRPVRSGPPVAEQLRAAVRGMPVVILPSQTSPRLLEDRSALARLRSRNVCRWETGSDQERKLIGFPLAIGLASAARPATVAVGGGDSGREPGVPAGDDSSPESGGVLGAIAAPFGDGSGGSRFAGAVLLLLLVPALVLLTLAAVPHRALLRVPATALARHHDDFVLLGLGWVVVWGLYIGVVYALSVILE